MAVYACAHINKFCFVIRSKCFIFFVTLSQFLVASYDYELSLSDGSYILFLCYYILTFPQQNV
jgi:hypothetical protein